ncbi:MAG: ThuA domain-containing protein [Oscillospiraceae bacterium]|nr:ThuA domain-containing protein [Oscillospiraceae bacterium]
MGKTALIFWGGWDGHEPEKVAKRFRRILEGEGFSVRVVQGADKLPGYDELAALDLLVPVTTGCKMPGEVSKAIAKAVGAGTGIAGCHGGMCDAYREDTEWQFMTGGQWVSHPGGDKVEYTVNVARNSSPLTQGIEDFQVKSEQYYLHVDPSIEVLATTRFPLVSYYHASNKPIDMPVVWTKYWGVGRVFYNSLGHHDDVFDQAPAAQELMRRGFLWAADGKRAAAAQGWTVDRYLNNAKMY